MSFFGEQIFEIENVTQSDSHTCKMLIDDLFRF